MAKQGKCDKCKTYFNWDKEIPFNKLCCPICSTYYRAIPLKRTTSEKGTGHKPRYKRRYLEQPPLKKLYSK